MTNKSLASVAQLATLAAAFPLTGCNTGPVYDSISIIEEAATDVAGTITLSAPQLYGRETLINDRRREVTFLSSKLDKVDTAFVPTTSSIVRNLQDIAGASFNAGVTIDNTNQLANRLSQAQGEAALDLAEAGEASRLAAYQEFLALDAQHRRLVAEVAANDQRRVGLQQLRDNPATSAETRAQVVQQLGALDIARAENGAQAAGLRAQLDALRSSLGLAPAQSFLTISPGAPLTQTRAAIDAELAKLGDYFKTPEAASSHSVTAPIRLGSSYKLSDSEALQEIRGYRQELRAAIAETELDDLHDYLGSTLYQMDFGLTVFPGSGANRRKYGVLDVQLAPPTIDIDLKNEDIAKLYTNWLQHVAVDANRHLNRDPYDSSRISYNASENMNEFTWTYVEVYRELGRRTKMFDLVEQDLTRVPKLVESYIGADPERACQSLSRLLEENNFNVLRLPDAAFQDMGDAKALNFWRDARSAATRYEPVLGPTACANLETRGYVNSLLSNQPLWASIFSERYGPAGRVAFLAPPGKGRDLGELLASTYDPTKTCESVEAVEDNLLISLRGYQKNMMGRGRDATANFISDALREIVAQCSKGGSGDVPGYDAFRDQILDGNTLKGSLRVLGANPTERGQTISTVANAVQSVQAAIAVSATDPVLGAGANLGASSLDRTAASVAAMERLPRVVSYADQGLGSGNFGWVIAPKVSLDPVNKVIALDQTLSNFQGSAEISAPGWWPHLTLKSTSYWVGNFNEPKAYSFDGEAASPQQMTVQLPTRAVDYDGLTQFIYGDRGALGAVFLAPQIDDIAPSSASLCSAKVTFVVKGKNLWRSAKVFAGGKEIKDVIVLPDMEGISFELGMTDVALDETRAPANGMRDLEIMIATRDGTAPRRLPVRLNSAAGTPCRPDDGASQDDGATPDTPAPDPQEE